MCHVTHSYVDLRKFLLVCDMYIGVCKEREHPRVLKTHSCVLLRKVDFRDLEDGIYIYEYQNDYFTPRGVNLDKR